MTTKKSTARTVHLVIEGRVQGVGFRLWVEREARRLGLSGWVRNLRTGAVETVLSGPDADVDAMVAGCAKGPPAAHVANVYKVADVTDGSLDTFDGFEVRPTV